MPPRKPKRTVGRPPLPGKGGTVITTMRWPRADWERVKAAAEARQQSASEYLRTLAREATLPAGRSER